jgi:hypothetical protein
MARRGSQCVLYRVAVTKPPQLQNGNPMAEVTLLQGTTFKKVMEKLD